jgi:hypothetical protein
MSRKLHACHFFPGRSASNIHWIEGRRASLDALSKEKKTFHFVEPYSPYFILAEM